MDKTLLEYRLNDSSLVILYENDTLNIKCAGEKILVRSKQTINGPITFKQYQERQQNQLTCNLNEDNTKQQNNVDELVEYKCINTCNINTLTHIIYKKSASLSLYNSKIGNLYPLDPSKEYYLNNEMIKFYCTTQDDDQQSDKNIFLNDEHRKILSIKCMNHNQWFINELMLLINDQNIIKTQCLTPLIQDNKQFETTSNENNSQFTYRLNYYLKKNFKNLLNLKLNIKLFLIILLISSLLIIVFLIFILIITFYKRYRLTHYYYLNSNNHNNSSNNDSSHQHITRSLPMNTTVVESVSNNDNSSNGDLSNSINSVSIRRSTRNRRLLNRLLRRQQLQQQLLLQMREDQLTFSIGSSSSLNQTNNNQNVYLPTYDEVLKTQQQSVVSQPPPALLQPPQSSSLPQVPPSPPPSFSAINKDNLSSSLNVNKHFSTSNNNGVTNCNNIETASAVLNNIDDTQSIYSSISAAPVLMKQQNNRNRTLKITNQQQRQICDSNETFSVNSACYLTSNQFNNSVANPSIGAHTYAGVSSSNSGGGEVCTIITNSSLNSAESNISKFVFRGSIDNNIDQQSLFNYSTSLSDAAIIHNEGKILKF